MTDRDVDLGSVAEEAYGTQRHEYHGGGQTKLPDLDVEEDASPTPGGDGKWSDRLQRPPGDRSEGRHDSVSPRDDVEAPGGLESFADEIGAELGSPRDSSSRIHAAPARRGPVRRPQDIEHLAEEVGPGAAAPHDPVGREDSLAEAIHQVSRAYALKRLADEVEREVRSPERGARTLAGAKGLELVLARLALAEMRLQRDPFRQPDGRVEERREMLASVLAVHGKGHPQLSPWMILERAPGRSNL